MTLFQTLNSVKNKLFVSQMFGCFQDRTSAFLVLRYEENGSLLDFINRSGKVPIDCAQAINAEIVIGLQHLHTQNIVHGDLKPENILLDKNLRAHVADFGLAVEINPKKPFIGKWGTKCYQSPEQLMDNVSWDHRVDYFNVGVIFLMMTTGKHPFGIKDSEIQRNVVKLRYRMPKFASDDARSFVMKTVCPNDDRLNCIDIMRHPFISSVADTIKTNYVSDCSIILHGDQLIEPFYDNINFFAPIPVVFFDEEPEQVEKSTSTVSQFDISFILCSTFCDAYNFLQPLRFT